MADPLTINAIKRAVSRQTGVTLLEMDSARREGRIVNARWLAIYLARHFTSASFPAIGRAFGDRDHSTIMHACQGAARLWPSPDAALHQLGITVA